MGGVASGKSTAARELDRLGAVVLDADRLAHEALESPSIAAAVVGKFGKEIVLPDGSLNRKKIAARVFEDIALRRWLESLLHPQVREKIDAGLAQAAKEGRRVVVLDVPLLAEAGLLDRCDTTLFIEASPSLREARAQSARGWAPGELAQREKNQADLEKKRQLAKHVIENSGSVKELESKIRSWLDIVLEKR